MSPNNAWIEYVRVELVQLLTYEYVYAVCGMRRICLCAHGIVGAFGVAFFMGCAAITIIVPSHELRGIFYSTKMHNFRNECSIVCIAIWMETLAAQSLTCLVEWVSIQQARCILFHCNSIRNLGRGGGAFDGKFIFWIDWSLKTRLSSVFVSLIIPNIRGKWFFFLLGESISIRIPSKNVQVNYWPENWFSLSWFYIFFRILVHH